MTSVVMAEYLFAINGHTPTDWQLKGVAVAGYTVAGLRRSTRTFAMRYSNTLQSWLFIPNLVITCLMALEYSKCLPWSCKSTSPYLYLYSS